MISDRQNRKKTEGDKRKTRGKEEESGYENIMEETSQGGECE